MVLGRDAEVGEVVPVAVEGLSRLVLPCGGEPEPLGSAVLASIKDCTGVTYRWCIWPDQGGSSCHEAPLERWLASAPGPVIRSRYQATVLAIPSLNGTTTS